MKIANIKFIHLFSLILLGAALTPTLAMAQIANGVGSVLTNTTTQTTSFDTILSIGSYVIGVSMAFWGLLRLKVWGDGGQANFGDGLWRIVAGAFMVGLPFTINTLVHSIFGSFVAGASGGANRISGMSQNPNGTLGLDQVVMNLIVDVYQPAKNLISIMAYLAGVTSVITGIYRLGQAGQAASGRAPSTKGTIGYIGGGALLISCGQLMDAISTSLFGSAQTAQFSSLSYNIANMNSGSVNNVVQAMFAFIEIVGWIAFVRGIFLLVKLAQGGGDKTHAHAFSHIIFGAAAVNMYQVVLVMQKSLGINIVN
jgi:hypothetical protein